MKKLFTLMLAVLAMNAAFSQSNVPNGDFENWYTVTLSPTLSYEDIGTGPADNWTSTLNSLAAVPPTAGGPGPVTVFKTGDKYSGTYAAKAVSANFPLGLINIFIPGMIGTAVMDMQGVKALLGKPCQDCKPLKLSGYFKFEPVNGDSCAALLLLSRWNQAEKKRDTVGFGKFVQKDPVSTYTKFEVPVNYSGSGAIDTMTLLIVSSAGFNVINFMGSIGQVGSTMYVDELMLEYPAGIQQSLMPEVSVTLTPNPASDILAVSFSKPLKDASFEVFTTAGRSIGSYSVAGNTLEIPVYSLPNGSYHYRLKQDKAVLKSGTFLIKRQ